MHGATSTHIWVDVSMHGATTTHIWVDVTSGGATTTHIWVDVTSGGATTTLLGIVASCSFAGSTVALDSDCRNAARVFLLCTHGCGN